MKVIVCDDNKEYVDQITGFFDRYTREHQKDFIVYPFYDAETMFEFFKKNTDIGIIVLDIVFVHSNGIEVAKKIRGINTKTRIFFISAYEKFAVEGYGLSADEYLLKPLKYLEFEKAISRALLKIQVDKNKIFVESTNQGKIVIDLDDILFFETCERKIKIHTTEGLFTSYRRMKEYEKRLEGEHFYRCHAAFIVNLLYISQIKDNVVLLKDGSEIMISKKRRKGFMSEFTKYIGSLVQI